MLNRCNLPERAVCEILEEAGMLVDDRTPTIERWFERVVADLPAPTVAELRVWLEVMALRQRYPSPATTPQRDNHPRLRHLCAQPALRLWASQGHGSLREISQDDLTAILPPSGADRALMIGASVDLLGPQIPQARLRQPCDADPPR